MYMRMALQVAALLQGGLKATYAQENFFFDGPNKELSSERAVLRLRFYNTDEKATLTLKVRCPRFPFHFLFHFHITTYRNNFEHLYSSGARSLDAPKIMRKYANTYIFEKSFFLFMSFFNCRARLYCRMESAERPKLKNRSTPRHRGPS